MSIKRFRKPPIYKICNTYLLSCPPFETELPEHKIQIQIHKIHEHKKVQEAVDIRSAIHICSRAPLSKELPEHKSFRQQI